MQVKPLYACDARARARADVMRTRVEALDAVTVAAGDSATALSALEPSDAVAVAWDLLHRATDVLRAEAEQVRNDALVELGVDLDASVFDPVGMPEIADRLGVQPDTVQKWRTRGIFPEPAWRVGGGPAWDWSTVVAWAEATGRAKDSGSDS